MYTRTFIRSLTALLLAAGFTTAHADGGSGHSRGSADASASAAPAAVEAKPTEATARKRPPRPKTDLIMTGDAKCTICHDEADDYPVLAIGLTRHGVDADARTPTCVSCHGESDQHLRVPRGSKGERPLPDLPYGKKSAGKTAQHNQSCINCHQGDKLTLWLGSAHARRDVPCSGCHKLHTGADKVLDRSTVAEVCMTCHTDKRALIQKPSRHPILEGKVVCTDCHAAHGSAGPKLMQKDSVVQTCYTCHMEKRGPFLWNHLPATQDCSICHNPHGSVNPNLLKQRPPFLCQQCHEPTSHRGNVPALGTTGPAPFGPGFNRVPAEARACLNCHTNLHGGNSTANTANSRTMRR